MSTTSVASEHAPQAIGPYSQAVMAGGLLFTAGQIALDPATGRMAEGGIVEQTNRVMKNLEAVLAAAGASWSDVTRCTVYLVDLADFPVFNETYGRHLGTARPARSTVQVAALPRGAVVEVDVIASLPV